MGILSKVSRLALEGMPSRVKVPRLGITLDVGPSEEIRAVAEQYMRDAGLPYEPIRKYAPINEERARRIANAFDEMRDDPQNKDVQAAFDAMARETLAQYDAIKKYGSLKTSWIEDGLDPYEASPRLATEDITKNNRFSVFPTDSGYGQTGITPEMEAINPMLRKTGEIIDGRDARVNDIFRIVHDYFGHAKEGVGFRADGEENAWRGHGSMYSPDALPAATSETRGQNSWLNYGPYGEKNRTASTADTVFAEQKIGLMPKWTWSDGLKDKDLALLLASILGTGTGAGLLGRVGGQTEV